MPCGLTPPRFYRVHGRPARGLQRRRQAEEQARQHGQRRRESEHSPVRRDIEEHRASAPGTKRYQHPAERLRDPRPDTRAQQRDQQAGSPTPAPARSPEPASDSPTAEASMAMDRRDHWWLASIGRLKPGWTLHKASAQLKTVSAGIFESTVPPNFRADGAKYYREYRLGSIPAGTGVSGLTNRPSAYCASPPCARLNRRSPHAMIEENACCLSRNCSHCGSVRQRSQPHRVDQCEDGRVSAHAKRQRQNRHRREARIQAQLPRSEA